MCIRDSLLRDARILGAHHQGRRLAEIGIVEQFAALLGRGDDLKPFGLEPVSYTHQMCIRDRDDIMHMDSPTHRKMVTPSQGVHLVLDMKFLQSDYAIMVPLSLIHI